MPDSQQAMHDNNPTDKAAYRAWASQVSTGVHQILSGRRGNVMPQKPKLDLCACLNLLDGDDPLPFAWDTSLYTNPPPLSAPRLGTAKVGSQQGDRTYSRPDSDEDYDDDDLDSVARPQWCAGEVRIVKLTEPPFWAMVRYINFEIFYCVINYFLFLCIAAGHRCRIQGLPYKRDGFWMGTVQRLFPQNKRSNWEGPWLPDGPPVEAFGSVLLHLMLNYM